MPAPQRVYVVHQFHKPVERVFAFVSEHENVPVLFGPVKVTRVCDGTDGTRNGVGSTRRLQIGPLPSFEETNVTVVPNQLIEYAITFGSPLRDHQGRIELEPRGDGGTRLTYSIRFDAVVPMLASVVAHALITSLRQGLPRADERA